MKSAISIAFTTLIIGILGFGLKFLAYLQTQSVALYSDALESIVNVIAACLLTFTVWLSERPADQNHHFGHQKAEYLSALFESICILIAALSIVVEAVKHFFEPQLFNYSIESLAVNGLATLLNAGWGGYLVYRGQKDRSPALYADGVHLVSDVFSSIFILVGMVITFYTKLWILDPILALGVGGYLFFTGFGVFRKSIDGLMDAVLDRDEYDHIVSIINANLEFALQAHGIKIRHAGKKVFIEFHLVIEGQRSVREAHELCDRIEEEIIRHYPSADINIHLEPEEYLENLADN